MYEQLLEKFQNGFYSEVVSCALDNNVSPGNDPRSAQVLAAAFFSLGQIQEALDILVDLESSLGDDDSYLSLYGAALRRVGDLEGSKSLFIRAISIAPDNPCLQNNYANLLIDLKEYDEAFDILLRVVDSNPKYDDAVSNLSRVKALQGSDNAPYKNSISLKSSIINDEQIDKLLDPLLLAFDSKEVKEHGRLQGLTELKAIQEKPDLRSIGIEKLQLARKAFAEKNFNFALQLCSQSYRQLGCESNVFDCASDSYLSLNRFLESELSILHSLAISGPSMKHYINLVGLASMRCDFRLAEYYLDKATCLDPSNINLARVRELLDQRKISKDNAPFLFEDKWHTEKIIASEA